MRIIDAHIHFCQADPYFDEIALAAGHENNAESLKQAFDGCGVEHAVVMGNRDIDLQSHNYPDFMSYCIGLDRVYVQQHGLQGAAELVDRHLQRKSCVGIKLYPGYCYSYVSDEIYRPFIELAQKHRKPVAIHTGATAGSRAILKYSHPLSIDEVAVRYPDVQFVMCHFGNPWLVDAAAVMEKNPNVAADLSGLLEGAVNVPAVLQEDAGYWDQVRIWTGYLNDYSRLMYGTDWPLVNVAQYIELIESLIPPEHREAVFFGNANRIYNLGL